LLYFPSPREASDQHRFSPAPDLPSRIEFLWTGIKPIRTLDIPFGYQLDCEMCGRQFANEGPEGAARVHRYEGLVNQLQAVGDDPLQRAYVRLMFVRHFQLGLQGLGFVWEHERAVLLPCGHVFGEICIRNWFLKEDDWYYDSCPKCRMQFFDLQATRFASYKNTCQLLQSILSVQRSSSEMIKLHSAVAAVDEVIDSQLGSQARERFDQADDTGTAPVLA